ncbi:Glycosyl hydrolase family 10 protein isoform 1 [Theobroma cacao]|uniref:Glycosyl hydrolase family 10 protein isoform 1 n=1 Tax=Theobroma cacao TaxID=3641 RepID=A0A061E086_THECC|nr:Glycosyl hydrolase family 10 protein isoform 1 [Theobroma cacao]
MFYTLQCGNMKHSPIFGGYLAFFFLLSISLAASYDGPAYDFTAYTECKAQPEEPLYQGGILKDQQPVMKRSIISETATGFYTPAFVLKNLTQGSVYCFSTWVRIQGANSALIRASLKTENRTYDCIGTVSAKSGCWSFLKGGFILDSPSNLALLLFQNSDDKDIDITIASSSLQPFTDQEWRINQQYIINTQRKRAATIHVSDQQGNRLQGAEITVDQVSKDFPFGSAIASTILGNLPYQSWFVERFNAAVFENELKWYATEPDQGKTNYTIADQMLEFVRAHQIIARGHNIFWEDPKYTPAWVRNLAGPELQSAVNSRIQSLMSKYKEEFIHWDVSNEMLHFDFYEQRLGPDATLHFYETAHQSDPLATLFMNEFNVVETCSDVKSTVDTYIERIRDLKQGGMYMDGIGLESHFTVPNPALMRAVLDKLATLGLPIWLTEVDISSSVGEELQAIYLEQVLREGFSHPSVNGIMLWTALHPKGCYEMCLTDKNFKNLPAGEVVDNLLKEWQTGEINGQTDEHGSYSFYGFLGEYKVNVSSGNRSANSTFSLCRSDETKHFSIQL